MKKQEWFLRLSVAGTMRWKPEAALGAPSRGSLPMSVQGRWSGQGPEVEKELASLTVLAAGVLGPGAPRRPSARRENSPFRAQG